MSVGPNAPNAPGWLTARPIAHRGLHDREAGLVENSAGAAKAAIARRFAIECDVQDTADGGVVVFHDFTLDRLTGETGLVRERSMADLAGIGLAGGGDRIPTLVDFLGLLDGRVPLVLEIKSRFDGDLRLTENTLRVIADYAGPIALKSFDPIVVAALRRLAPSRPRGIIAQGVYDYAEWDERPPAMKHALANLLHVAETEPDFLSWRVKDLPHAAPNLFRHYGGGRPVMSWTVRTEPERRLAAKHADQMVFEGFVP